MVVQVIFQALDSGQFVFAVLMEALIFYVLLKFYSLTYTLILVMQMYFDKVQYLVTNNKFIQLCGAGRLSRL